MVVKEGSLRGYNPRMDFDVVIIGGGLAGASLAAALAESGLRLALIERKAPPSPGPDWDSRVYALTPASTAFLDRVGAWRRVEAGRVTPVYVMRVFGDDGRSRLEFSAYESGTLQLAATVESSRLRHALWQGLERQPNLSLLCPATPAGLRLVGNRVEIGLEDGTVVAAKLAVGADGAESWARRAAGIEALNASYSQLGIVANFSCAREHRNIAYQWFRSDGVLAYLPLAGQRVSIVWSTRQGQARELLALAPAVFCADRKSTRLNSSHSQISYAVFCLKKKKKRNTLHQKTTDTKAKSTTYSKFFIDSQNIAQDEGTYRSSKVCVSVLSTVDCMYKIRAE